jgi:Cof subfamily protein (haloacid dehalogenase superfamily)
MTEQKRIRLIALDLDGTLLNRSFELTDEVRRSVRSAQQAGINVILATGRDFNSAQPFLRELDMEHMVITSGGALIWMNGKIVLEKSFTTPQINCILELGTKYDVGCFLDQAEKTWMFGNSYYVEMYKHVSKGTNLELVDKVFDPLPIKVSLIQERTVLSRLRAELTSVYPDLNTAFPFEHVLDINQSDSSKGLALTWLATALGIEMAEVAVVGDSENDVSMFEVAGLSFAMANSPEHVQKAANHVVSGNDRNGVGQVIKIILGQCSR